MQILKILGQSSPAAAALTALYRAPACACTTANTLVVCNRSAIATTFRIAVAPKAEADAVQHYLYYDHALGGNAAHAAVLELKLGESDEVRVYAAAATVSFNLFGVEIL
jgi:hypothetical protein